MPRLKQAAEKVQRKTTTVGILRQLSSNTEANKSTRSMRYKSSGSISRMGEPEFSPEFRNSIFCFGGYGGETECLAYVTTADKWVPLANLPVGKVNATTCPTGVLERDRSIIIAGGRDINGRASKSAYRFDCNYLIWKPIAAMQQKREGSGSAFSSGHAFVVGGKTPHEWTNSVEYFNPVANKWTEVSPMKHSREGCGAASLSDKLWVVGGNQYGNSDLDIAEWYELKKDKWTQGPTLNESRWGCGLVSAGGALYAIGGYRTATVERLDPREGRWGYLESMEVRRDKVSVALHGDNVYAFGGWIDGSRITTVEKYDIRNNKWSFCEPLPHSKSGVAMTSLFGVLK